jgi:hypothetical protein
MVAEGMSSDHLRQGTEKCLHTSLSPRLLEKHHSCIVTKVSEGGNAALLEYVMGLLDLGWRYSPLVLGLMRD